MLSRTVTLATLVEAGVPLSWREAIALAQGIAELSQQSSARQNVDPLSHVALDPDGVVTAPSGSAAVSQSELALFLVQVLRPDAADGLESTPPGVYAVISRALGLSEEPAFGSVAELSGALQPFECGNRRLLRGVYMRCMQHQDYTLHAATVREGNKSDETRAGSAERRRTGPQVAALRRMLRELDRDAYLMRVAEATRARAPRESGLLSSFIPLSALAFAVLVTASAGNAQRQDEVRNPVRAARMEPSSAKSGDAQASSMIQNPSKPATVDPGVVESVGSRAAEARVASRLDGRLAAGHGPRVQGTERHPVAHAGVPLASARRQMATTESALVPPRTARRWPRRLIAAIGHRLSSAFRGA